MDRKGGGGLYYALACSLGHCALACGCAGRDAQPTAMVQTQDVYSDCAIIRAEIQANNVKATELANEQGWKVAQNVAAQRCRPGSRPRPAISLRDRADAAQGVAGLTLALPARAAFCSRDRCRLPQPLAQAWSNLASNPAHGS